VDLFVEGHRSGELYARDPKLLRGRRLNCSDIIHSVVRAAPRL
jgi:hypothetical protein